MKSTLAAAALAIIATFAANQAQAGAAQAVITCVSDSGKTKIESEFPGDMMETGIAFSIEGKTLAYMDTNMKDALSWNPHIAKDSPYAEAAITDFQIVDSKKELKIVALKAGAPVLTLKSVPGTIKMKSTYGGSRGKLKATVQGVDPRHGGPSKLITVNCEYVYEI